MTGGKKRCENWLRLALCFTIFFGLNYPSQAGVQQNFKENAVVKIFSYLNVDLEEISVRGHKYPLALPNVVHGSGWMVTSEGLVVTAKHVVEDGGFVAVWIQGFARAYPATVVYEDDTIDLAFLYVRGDFPENSQPLPVTSTTPSRAEEIYVYGFPIFAGEPEVSVTRGIVSRFTSEGLIQIDAALNPGNSGGPVLNAKGDVLGIAVAKAKGSEGMGYVVPIGNLIAVQKELQAVKRLEEVKGQVISTPHDQREAQRTLANFLARTAVDPTQFIQETLGEGTTIMKKLLSFALSEKQTRETAVFVLLTGAYAWNTAMAVLVGRGLDLSRLSELPEDERESVLNNIALAGQLAESATKMNPVLALTESDFTASLRKVASSPGDLSAGRSSSTAGGACEALINVMTGPVLEGILKSIGLEYKVSEEDLNVFLVGRGRGLFGVVIKNEGKDLQLVHVEFKDAIRTRDVDRKLMAANDWNNEHRFSTASVTSEGLFLLTHDLDLRNGVTRDSIAEFVRFHHIVIPKYQEFLRKKGVVH
jgi:S1-C subfamily serine protease